MGYTNVFVYNEGLPEWVKRGYPADLKKVYPAIEVPVISAADLKAMMDRKEKLFILDIRDEDDLKAGTLKGAKAIELEVLDANLAKVPKGRKIVIMDLHGKQTNMAGRFLASKGYEDLVRLDGGFVSGWLKAGYPVEK
jgi:rhodanese-related sulfurtransferase